MTVIALDPWALPKLYINIDRRVDRRRRMEAAVARHPTFCNLVRVPGHDGAAIEDFGRLPRGVRISDRQRRHVEQGGTGRGGMHTAGSVGLGLSYKAALDLVIACRFEHTLILEDDALLVDDFGDRLAALRLPPDFDMVFLGYSSAPRAVPLGDGLMKVHRIYGTFGMLWSLRGARKVVEELKLFDPFKYALDTRFYFDLDPAALNKYGLVDPIVLHPPQNTPDDPSDIVVR